jgi:hypothetical protein
MRNHLPAALLAAAFLGVPALSTAAPTPAPASGSSVATSPTQPPQIIHIYTRHLCTVLTKTIAPAIGMMLQNDKTIAKSPDIFKDYNFAMGYGSQGSQDMAVMRMENLVGPLADNVIAIHKQLDDLNAFPPVPRTKDEQHLQQLKDELLKTLASQEASLDIINGFVATQQLSEMQHEGFGYIGAIASPDTKNAQQPNQQNTVGGSLLATPPPGYQDEQATLSNAGLPSNPYELDLARLPGLTLGYNPVTRLREGVIWTQSDAQKNEDTLSRDVIETANACKSQTTVLPNSPNPSPSPKP